MVWPFFKIFDYLWHFFRLSSNNNYFLSLVIGKHINFFVLQIVTYLTHFYSLDIYLFSAGDWSSCILSKRISLFFESKYVQKRISLKYPRTSRLQGTFRFIDDLCAVTNNATLFFFFGKNKSVILHYLHASISNSFLWFNIFRVPKDRYMHS